MDFLASSFPCHHQSVPTSSPLSPHFPLLPIYFLLGLSLCRMDSVWRCHYNKKGELGERRKKKQAGLGLFHIANRKQGKVLHENNIQWNLWNKDTAGPCKSVLISEVSLIRRFPYNSCNIMLYNSGPRTLVHIVEVSVIGESVFGGSTVLTLYHIAIHQVYQTEGGVIYYAHIPWCYHFHHTTSKSTTLYTTAIIDVQGKKQ